MYAFYVTQGTIVYFMTITLTLWLGCKQLMMRQSFFVGDANAHHSEWLESVSPTDRHGRDAHDFSNLSGCEQLVRGPTHIAGNRLNLVMTDVPAIVDVVVGRFVPTTVLRRRSKDKQQFDASCLRAYDAKQTAYRAWCRAGNTEHWGQFVLARARPRGSMVLQGSLIMSSPGILKTLYLFT